MNDQWPQQVALLVLHLLTVVVVPPLLPGLINRVKAILAGRRGPPVRQLYWDLAKAWRKGSVISSTTTWMFLAGPTVAVVTGLIAALLVPLGHAGSPLGFSGDVVLFAYLLGLGRFFTAAAALDTGSAFEGMGASREMTFSALTEPALFLGLAALAVHSQSLHLDGMVLAVGGTWNGPLAGSLLLVLAGWFVVLLVESCRIPFDDPNTHLELTMIHEVMVLDHSGPPLACVLYGASLKLFAIAALVVGLCLPTTGNPWYDWLAFLGALMALAVVIGLVESSMARLRMPRVPQLLVAATLACAFGFLLMLM